MRLGFFGLACSTALVVAAPFYTRGEQPSKLPSTAELRIVHTYCLKCHSGASPAAGLDLSPYKTAASVQAHRQIWEKVATNVASGHMPPAGQPHPTQAQRQALATWIETTVTADCRLADPGRVTIRRLNRTEYDNTVRDLLGIDFHPADDFPSDDVGYGFDDIGDVLSVSPLLMEKYLTAAEQIAEKAIRVPTGPTKFTGDRLVSSQTLTDNDQRELYTNGSATASFTAERAGSYRVEIEAWGDQAGPEPCKMALEVDGRSVQQFVVANKQGHPGLFGGPLALSAGDHKISATFLNDYYNPSAPANDRDRNLFIDFIQVKPPADDAASVPQSQRSLIPYRPTDPMKDGRRMLASFASKAFRRPVRQDEMDGLMRLFSASQKGGDPFERSMQIGVEAILTSPSFLFRVELDSKPNDPKAARLLNGYELAARLSYFLWASTPDDELLTLAASGKLQTPQVLAHEAARMLQDPKARSLTDDFASQWLQLRKLKTVSIDSQKYSDFNESLRNEMITETRMFFDSVRRQDRSVLDLINGKYTFLNGDLARHYGIAGVEGPEFRKVALTDGRRAGILTQASVLTVTSNPTRTSPTKRGKWILEQILGTPPPPPPPGVSNLADEKQATSTATLRKLMEMHRAKPMCASCHSQMDPLGFGLENFDATGRWRDRDGDVAIDSSGVLPDGRKFSGPAQLRGLLLAKKSQFVRSLSEKLLTYALGRGLEDYDRCATDTILKQTEAGNYRISALIKAIVLSDPFRKRRGDGGTE